MANSNIHCPACGSHRLVLKYQATYEYSYILDENAPGLCNDKELLSYMYDSREQKEAKQFIACDDCHTAFPCYFDEWNGGITAAAIQQALAAASEKM